MDKIRPEIYRRQRFAEIKGAEYFKLVNDLWKGGGHPIVCIHIDKVCQARRIFTYYRNEYNKALDIINKRKFIKGEYVLDKDHPNYVVGQSVQESVQLRTNQ